MKYIRNSLLWLPALLWCWVIWVFSAQMAVVSGDLSDRLLWRLMTLACPAFARADTNIQSAAVELLSFFERKAAHMFLYFVLILLLWLALLPLLRGKRRQIPAALALCTALAALDEYHQTFIPGRSGELRDVCVDMTGAALAVALVGLLRWAAHQRKASRRSPASWLPLVLCASLTVVIAAVPSPFGELPVFAWSVERFVLDYPTLDVPAQTALLAALSPILREALFLAACGLLGASSVLSAALAVRKSLLAAGAALGLSVALPVLIALLRSLPLLPAVSLVAIGWAVGIVLWLICLAADGIAERHRKNAPESVL